MRPIVRMSIFASVASVLIWGAFTLWHNNNTLKKYGVSWNITSGEHSEYQTLWLHWNRNYAQIEGPAINGEDLYVRLIYSDGNKIPDIIIKSGTKSAAYVLLRLNFSDKNKPEFEMIENHDMNVHYSPPWDGYYKD